MKIKTVIERPSMFLKGVNKARKEDMKKITPPSRIFVGFKGKNGKTRVKKDTSFKDYQKKKGRPCHPLSH